MAMGANLATTLGGLDAALDRDVSLPVQEGDHVIVAGPAARIDMTCG